VTTTGQERAADGFGGERVIFFDVPGLGGCGEGSRMRMEKVWGKLVDYRLSNGGASVVRTR
jgi:hypothetical protein